MRHLFLPCVLSMVTALGCASAPEAAPVANRPLPEPATFRMTGTMSVNLTPEIAARTGLPQVIKGTLEANARADAVSVNPERSRHEGHLRVVVTDDSGQLTLATVDLHVDGEAAGSPTASLGQVTRRFLDAAALLTRPALQRIDDAAR